MSRHFPVIALVAALRHELQPLLALGNWTRDSCRGRNFYRRELNGSDVVATTSGLGKVMAAATTQFLVDRFAASLVLNFGSCGALTPELKVGDLVLASRVVEYDFISDYKPAPTAVIDAGLLGLIGRRFPELRQGGLASADRNADTPEIRSRLHDELEAVIADWEGAAVVRVARRLGVEALVLRGVTDIGEDGLTEEYEKHHQKVLPAVAGKTLELAEFLAGLEKTET
jgi:adenosylhomocysteine nucleosidase